MKDLKKVLEEISIALQPIPTDWEGREAILAMKEGGSRNWRQMEWMGFYFEFLCENLLREVMEIPGPKYGNVGFDALHVIPWDFKVHAINTSSHTIIINDAIAIQAAIQEYGAVGIVLGLGEVEYNDKEATFRKWHDHLKGKQSAYVRERKRRGAWSRLRKTHVDLQQILFVKIDGVALSRTGSFQEKFRNADGSPRQKKVTIDLEKLDKEIVGSIEF